MYAAALDEGGKIRGSLRDDTDPQLLIYQNTSRDQLLGRSHAFRWSVLEDGRRILHHDNLHPALQQLQHM